VVGQHAVPAACEGRRGRAESTRHKVFPGKRRCAHRRPPGQMSREKGGPAPRPAVMLFPVLPGQRGLDDPHHLFHRQSSPYQQDRIVPKEVSLDVGPQADVLHRAAFLRWDWPPAVRTRHRAIRVCGVRRDAAFGASLAPAMLTPPCRGSAGIPRPTRTPVCRRPGPLPVTVLHPLGIEELNFRS
jgi:hypothetical protein